MLKQNLQGKTVLDIGANKGIYSYWLSRSVGKDGRVIAFEPQPELGNFLQDVRSTFALSNLEIANTALSDQVGEQTLFRDKAGCGGATFTKYDSNEEIVVRKQTLDSYVKENSISDIGFIKCDVERHELEVFAGAKETLQKFKPILLFECHHNEAKQGRVFRFLKNLGYSGFFISSGKQIPYDRFDKYLYFRGSAVGHRNYFFYP